MDTTFLALACTKLAIFLLMTFIYIPYCLWLFLRDRGQSYVDKRRPMLVVTITISQVVDSAGYE